MKETDKILIVWGLLVVFVIGYMLGAICEKEFKVISYQWERHN